MPDWALAAAGPAGVIFSYQSRMPAGAGAPRDENVGKPALFHGTGALPCPTQGIHKGCPLRRFLVSSEFRLEQHKGYAIFVPFIHTDRGRHTKG